MSTFNKQDMLERLSNLHVKLKEYQAYRTIDAARGLAENEISEMYSLRETLVGERGVLEPLVTKLTGSPILRDVGKGPEYDRNMWNAALDRVYDKQAKSALDICIDTVNQALRLFESDV
jgi:hypothetical protein